MDPLMFAALTGVAAAGVGFVVGGALHNEIWKLVSKKQFQQLTKVPASYLNYQFYLPDHTCNSHNHFMYTVKYE